MTHRSDNKAFNQVLEVLIENGLEGMASAMEVIFNEAMKIERAGFLGAEPHERTLDRRGYGNGYKDKTVRSRIGELKLKIPQVRDLKDPAVGFYPKSLERGLRSERALKLAIAEMYVQGVSTRRVKEITRELCGLDVSSTEVSRAAKLLDEELSRWRDRAIGEIPYLILDARYEKIRHGGSVVDCAVLVAVGVRSDGTHPTVSPGVVGQRTILTTALVSSVEILMVEGSLSMSISSRISYARADTAIKINTKLLKRNRNHLRRFIHLSMSITCLYSSHMPQSP
jgi:putative transposase